MLSLWMPGEPPLWMGDFPVHAEALLEATDILIAHPLATVTCYHTFSTENEDIDGTHQWDAWRETIHDNYVTVEGPMFQGHIDITEDIT